MKGIVEEGEIVGGWVEAEEGIISIDRGVRVQSRLLQSFVGFWWNGIVVKVIIRVVEGSFGLGRDGKREVGNAVARPLLAVTDALLERCETCPPKSWVEYLDGCCRWYA